MHLQSTSKAVFMLYLVLGLSYMLKCFIKALKHLCKLIETFMLS